MSWEDLDSELAEIFDGYSWRRDELHEAIAIRSAYKDSVSPERAEWQRNSRIYRDKRRAIQKRYRDKAKPWRRPENQVKAKEHQRKYRASRTPEQRAAEAERVRKWRSANAERNREHQRKWRLANAERVNAEQREKRRRMKEAA